MTKSKAETRAALNRGMKLLLNHPEVFGLTLADVAEFQRRVTRKAFGLR